MKPDVIIIGSGIGGLTAAVALANHGKRVLVLEQHSVPGGYCHNFSHRGFEFSPATHYVGDVAPGGTFGTILKGLGVASELTFCQLNPEGYDHLLIGDERFDIPAGLDRQVDAIVARHPEQERGIRNLFRRLEQVAKEFKLAGTYLKGWRILLAPWVLRHFLWYGSRSIGKWVAEITSDPFLRTVLTYRAGLNAVAPSRASVLSHANTVSHYAGGGYYPRGGGQSIANALVGQLQRRGGEVRLSTEVQTIVVEGGRAVGVVLEDGERIDAETIISNADPEVTFNRLVGEENLSPALRERVRNTTYSLSSVILFAATDLDLRAMGLDSGNYWYFARPDLEGILNDCAETLPDPFESLFLCVPTLKDPSLRSDGLHTIEVVAMAPYGPFEEWSQTRWRHRGEAYEELKADLEARILAQVERIIPGLRDHLLFSDVSTPLTNAHFCRSTRGGIYGTEKVIEQSGPKGYPIATEIDRLYMVGSATLSHGIAGVCLTGMVAASQILGKSFPEILTEKGEEVVIVPSERPERWLHRTEVTNAARAR